MYTTGKKQKNWSSKSKEMEKRTTAETKPQTEQETAEEHRFQKIGKNKLVLKNVVKFQKKWVIQRKKDQSLTNINKFIFI